jgi:hypothetical protein
MVLSFFFHRSDETPAETSGMQVGRAKLLKSFECHENRTWK